MFKCQLLPNISEYLFRGAAGRPDPGSITIVVLQFLALYGRLAFGFEEEKGQSSAILTSVRDSGERADENLTIGRHDRGRC